MIRFIGATRVLRALVVAMSLLAAGCGSGSSSTPQNGGTSAAGVVNITPKVLLDTVNSAIQQPVARALGGWEWGGFLSTFGTLLTSINYDNTLDMQKVTYQSIGADGWPTP